MESYVEVSMLHNTATILLSFLMASYACVQPLPIRKMLVYALALSIPGCLLFFPGSWLFLVKEYRSCLFLPPMRHILRNRT